MCLRGSAAGQPYWSKRATCRAHARVAPPATARARSESHSAGIASSLALQTFAPSPFWHSLPSQNSGVGENQRWPLAQMRFRSDSIIEDHGRAIGGPNEDLSVRTAFLAK